MFVCLFLTVDSRVFQRHYLGRHYIVWLKPWLITLSVLPLGSEYARPQYAAGKAMPTACWICHYNGWEDGGQGLHGIPGEKLDEMLTWGCLRKISTCTRSSLLRKQAENWNFRGVTAPSLFSLHEDQWRKALPLERNENMKSPRCASAAQTNCHRLCGLKSRNGVSHSSGDLKPEIKVSARLVPGGQRRQGSDLSLSP